jgi:hypothetical protein
MSQWEENLKRMRQAKHGSRQATQIQTLMSKPGGTGLRTADAALPTENKANFQFYSRSSDGLWRYHEASSVYTKLDPGYYEIGADMGGWFLAPRSTDADEILDIPNPSATKALGFAESFIRDEYKSGLQQLGMLNKLSMLFWGDPGTSKSITMTRIAQYAIERGWVVIEAPSSYSGYFKLLSKVLAAIRSAEPDRGIVVIWDEFDSLVMDYEAMVLQMLDGQEQINHVLHLMATNYIDRLPARILTRCRRISFQMEFDFPTAEERAAYFKQKLAKLPEPIRTTVDIDEWVAKTDGLSLDNCAQVVVGVFAYHQTLDQVLTDLRQRLKIAGQPRGDEAQRGRYKRKYNDEEAEGSVKGYKR